MGTVLQYPLVYCSEKGMRKAVCIAIQTGCACKGVGRRRRSAEAGRARTLGERAQGAGARYGQARGPLAAAGEGCGRGARPGRAAGPTGCALGALGLFLTQFDSVLFLSQFLDIAREPGS